jgi:PKD repeat protein
MLMESFHATRRATFAVMVLMLFGLLATGGFASAHVMTRVSVDNAGEQGDANSFNASISADGRYVAFDSNATNLVHGDTNGRTDVFVHDRQTRQTTRVSIASDDSQGNGDSSDPAISGDGRYVAFHSLANNLVPGDTNQVWDVFVHDRETGQTRRVSVSSSGAQANNHSHMSDGRVAISADGRFVTFGSRASNLVPGDTNGAGDVFVHDLVTGQTMRVSVASDGIQGDRSSTSGGISGDGRFVTFASLATNLVSADTNGRQDVFVHDRQTGQTMRVSVSSDGVQGNDTSSGPAISADGSLVTFISISTNLIPGLTSSVWNIYAHNRLTGELTQVTAPYQGTQPNDNTSFRPASISADGRYVAFSSVARNLVEDYTRLGSDAYVRDLHTSTTFIVSVNSAGVQGNNHSTHPSISADGRFVAFDSIASNLVGGDTNGAYDIFVVDRDPPTNTAPVASVDSDTVMVDEGGRATNTGTYVDPDSDDVTLGASIGTVTMTGTSSGTWLWEFATSDGPAESQTVTITADDGHGGVTTVTFDLVVDNVPPQVAAPVVDPAPSDEGETVTARATFTDPGAADAPFSCTVDYGDGTGPQAGEVSDDACEGPPHTYVDDGEYAVTIAVTDKDGDTGYNTVSHAVLNVAPTVGPIMGLPADPVALDDATVDASATFTDPGVRDTHTAVWDWGDGTTAPGLIDQYTVTGSHTYSAPGIYPVRLTVTDNAGDSGEALFEYVMVFDPDGSSLTAAGWFESPDGAYAADASLTGRAHLSLNARYGTNATVPSGNLNFRLQANDLHLQAKSFDWLLFTGAQAQIRGTGTVNRSGSYGFIVTVLDGSHPDGGGTDMVRVKIWDSDSGAVIYDSQVGDPDHAAPASALGGGSVKVG